MSVLFRWHKELDPKTREGICGELRWVECDPSKGYTLTGREAFGSIPDGHWVDGGFCGRVAYGHSYSEEGYTAGVLKCPLHGGPRDKSFTGI